MHRYFHIGDMEFQKDVQETSGAGGGGEKQTNCNRFDWVSFEATCEFNLATFASCSLATCFHRQCRRSWSEIRSENKPNWRTYRLEWIISRGVAVMRSVQLLRNTKNGVGFKSFQTLEHSAEVQVQVSPT